MYGVADIWRLLVVLPVTDLQALLIKHEGMKLTAYRDTVGKLTIGVGHNLDDRPITEAAAMQILWDDIVIAKGDLMEGLGNWPWIMTDARLAVLVDMCFNMGINRLKGFARMLTAMKAGDYETAAKEMLNSKWAKQVGNRAVELAEMMRQG